MDVFQIIGIIAATCTTISFVPQALSIIKTKNTKAISLGMYSILTFGIFMWLVYGISKNDLPMILANGISFVLTSIILVMKIKYK